MTSEAREGGICRKLRLDEHIMCVVCGARGIMCVVESVLWVAQG